MEVTAPDPYTAGKAIAAIRADWKTVPQPSRSEIFNLVKSTANEGARDHDNKGDVSASYSGADVN